MTIGTSSTSKEMQTSSTYQAPTQEREGEFNNEVFWAELIGILEDGKITSDLSYYIDGKATPEDFANIIQVIFERTEPGSAERQQVVDLLDEAGFWADTDDRDYWENIDINDPAVAQDLESLKAAAGERMGNLFGGPGGTPGPDPTGGAGPDPETALTILSSPTLEYYKDPNTGKWYASYKLPNSDRRIFFDVTEDQLTAMFGATQRPNFISRTFKSLSGDDNYTYSGNIAEMTGDGSFEDEVAHVTALGLEEGLLPSWASEDPEIMDLIYIAQSEGKSNEWLIEKIAGTESFKARFPNIEIIKSQGNLTYEQAITGFLEYEAGLNALAGSVDTEYQVAPETVGALMEAGYSLDAATDAVRRIDRMNKFAPALEAFNDVLVSQGYDGFQTVQEMFDFMAGNAPQEVYDIWEASSVAEAASSAGLGDVFSAEDAMEFAQFSTGMTSLDDASAAFQSAASLLLRLRHEVEVEKFGLTTDDLIDMSLGMPPASGVSAADIQQNINRAIQSAQTSMSQSLSPYIAFGSDGTPQRASLGGLRRQS